MPINNFLDELTHTIVFAHRGASAYAPENTLAAFELAIRQGANAIELDTKLSADGQPVVIHDQTVNRTTSQNGKVSSFTLEQLCSLDAGSFFDEAFRGEPIPSLDQVFETVGGRTFLNVELTNYASPTDDLPEKVADLVKRHNLAQRVIFSSFNPIALARVRSQLPDTPIGLIALKGWAGSWARGRIGRQLNYQSLHPNFKDITAQFVQDVHKRGCKVFVWTVNRAEDMEQLVRLGVDGIISDDPALVKQVLHQ